MIVIRPLAAPEVDLALDWAAQEGWNPGLHDADVFLAQDPKGFIGAFADGALAACISAVRYESGFGFVGFYICRPDLRGRGIGLQVWQAGLARLEGRTIGLDGVVAQQDNYRRSGFALAHRNIRFGGRAAPGAMADGVRAVTPEDHAEIAAFDRAHFGVARPAFLARWLRPRAGQALIARTSRGGMAGYGVVRACRAGHKIGPLFAADPEVAGALFAGLSDAAFRAAPDAPLFLDVPEPNKAGCALARRAGLAPVFETARMYKGEAPALPVNGIFGITTFELG